MDSLQLYSTLKKSTVHLISSVYSSSLDSLQIDVLSVQQQEGSTDCALFAIANAAEMCNANNPENCHFNQALLTKHLLDCFNKIRLCRFQNRSLSFYQGLIGYVIQLICFVSVECRKIGIQS